MAKRRKTFDDLTKANFGVATLAFKSKKQTSINTWEITRFLSDLNTYYFKIELINSISKALSNGIKPENIIILNESFMLNHIYGQMDEIPIESPKLSLLYYVGLPFSLIPNINVLKMRMIFRVFRHINEVLARNRIARNKQNDIYLYYKLCCSKDFSTGVDSLVKDSIDKIKATIKKDQVKTDILEHIKGIKTEYEKEEKIIIGFDNTIKNINDNKKIKRIPKEFEIFSKVFSRVQRPVVIAIDEATKSGRVLCRNQLNKKKQDENTFTLRKVLHNSPFDIVITGGVSIVLAIADEKRKKELHQYEIEMRKLEIKKKQTELETARVDNIRAKIDLLTKIGEVENSDKIYQLRNVTNPYLHQELSKLHQNVIGCYQGLSDKTGLNINLDDSHIDLLV